MPTPQLGHGGFPGERSGFYVPAVPTEGPAQAPAGRGYQSRSSTLVRSVAALAFAFGIVPPAEPVQALPEGDQLFPTSTMRQAGQTPPAFLGRVPPDTVWDRPAGAQALSQPASLPFSLRVGITVGQPPPSASQEPAARGFLSRPSILVTASNTVRFGVMPPADATAAEAMPAGILGFQARPSILTTPINSVRFGAIPPPDAAAAEALPPGARLEARPGPQTRALETAFGRIPPPDAAAPALPAGMVHIGRFQPAAPRAASSAFFDEGQVPPPPGAALPSGTVAIGQREPAAQRAAVLAYVAEGRIPPPNSTALAPPSRGLQARRQFAPLRAAVSAYETTGRIPPANIEAVPIGDQEISRPLIASVRAIPASLIRRGPPADIVALPGPDSRYGLAKAQLRILEHSPEFQFGRIPPPQLELLGGGVVLIARPLNVPDLGQSTTSMGQIPPPPQNPVEGVPAIARPQLAPSRAASLTFVIAVPAVAEAEVPPPGETLVGLPQFSPARAATSGFFKEGTLPRDIEPLPAAKPLVSTPISAPARVAAIAYETVLQSSRPIPDDAIQPVPEGRQEIGRLRVDPRSAVAAYDVLGRTPPPNIEALPPQGGALAGAPLPQRTKAPDFAFRPIPPIQVEALGGGVIIVARPIQAPKVTASSTFAPGRIPPPVQELPEGARAISRSQLTPTRAASLVEILARPAVAERELVPAGTSSIARPQFAPARSAPAAYFEPGRIPPDVAALPSASPIIAKPLFAAPRAALIAYESVGRIPPPNAEVLPPGTILLRNGERSAPRASAAAYWFENRFVATSEVTYVVLLLQLQGEVADLIELEGDVSDLSGLRGQASDLEDLEGLP